MDFSIGANLQIGVTNNVKHTTHKSFEYFFFNCLSIQNNMLYLSKIKTNYYGKC